MNNLYQKLEATPKKNLVRYQKTKSVIPRIKTYTLNNKFHSNLVTFSFYIYLIFSWFKNEFTFKIKKCTIPLFE